MMTLDSCAMNLTVHTDLQRSASDLFRKSIQNGVFGRWWRQIAGRQVGLRSLDETPRGAGRDLGHRTVAIAEIIGSEGRTRDFDAGFAPISDRTRDRWVSVAQARLRGRALPAVMLVCAEDGYYVRDGHHRISVARALGEEFVEAEVVAWS
jgi:hypothetical protein